MKNKNSGQINTKNKSKLFNSEKSPTQNKTKNSKKLPPQLQSLQTQNIFNSNKKNNINNLTATSNSFLSRKLSEQKIQTTKNSEAKNKKRVFSQSPTNSKKPEAPPNSDNKKYINVNLSSESYGFNLYKHLKENLRNKEKLCKDKLTKESFYCMDCKLSTCKKCLNFNIHKGHNLIQKYLYITCDEKIFNNCFDSIDSIFDNKDKSIILNNQKLKEEMKNLIKENIDNVIKRLNELKNKKLKEIDKLFESTDGCVDFFKEKEKNIKNDLKNYLSSQKEFYNLQIEEEISTKASSARTGNNQDLDLINNFKMEGINESQVNRDRFNTVFLSNYDLFKNTEYINGEIRKLIEDIDNNRDRYMKYFLENIKLINSEIDIFNEEFKGVFNYRYLTNDFYNSISEKLNKYLEKISQMKKYIYDTVNKDGTFEKILKDNNTHETKIKQRFDNILSNQFDDKSGTDSLTSFSKNTNTNSNKLSSHLNLTLLSRLSSNYYQTKNSGDKNTKNQIYKNEEEIKLDKPLLQEFFSYETFNTIRTHFKKNKQKKLDEIITNETYLDKDFDIAKPIPGTNEIQLYDKKTTTLSRKVVKFEKSKHKYNNFLHGCRSVLIKDNLYILGGVDQDKISTRIAYVYYIKTNELKLMRDMICPHAYHSVQFLDYYKSIIVIGGENSPQCELYDLNVGLWRRLPDLNIPRSFCNLYLDKFTHAIYTFFGLVGNLTQKKNFTDAIEVLELKRLSLGWNKIDYENKAEMDFKSGYNKILPLNREMILIYGATNMRDFVKKAAVYLVPKFEIVKIDNKIFKEIKETSKSDKKLEKILSSYI